MGRSHEVLKAFVSMKSTNSANKVYFVYMIACVYIYIYIYICMYICECIYACKCA